MAWSAAARNTRLGPKTELKTLDGYWVRPQKLSVDARNELRRLSAGMAAKMPPSERKELNDIQAKLRAERERIDELRENGEGADTEFDLHTFLSDEEWHTLIGSFETIESQLPMMRLYLLKGIGDHNFDDEDGEQVPWGLDLVEQLLEYEDVAEEIFNIVRAWDHPLAQGSEGSSSTQSSIDSEG